MESRQRRTSCAGGDLLERDTRSIVLVVAVSFSCSVTRTDTACTLDVVVEAEVLVAVLFQEFEGVVRAKVLELDACIGPARRDGIDPLLHKRKVRVSDQTLLMYSEVARIVQQFLIICTDIHRDRQGTKRVDPSASHVQVKFSHRNLFEDPQTLQGVSKREGNDTCPRRE